MARFRYLILDSWTRARSGGMEHSHYLTRFRTVVLFWLMTTPDGDDSLGLDGTLTSDDYL
jgi:hypothetical protein